jgi:hypothetical protein
MNKNIKKYAFSFNKFNKIASGEGLRYLSLEFQELEDDVNELMSKYFKTYKDNKRAISDVGTLKIIHGSLVRIRNDLDNYHELSKELFRKFKKYIVSHDREKLKKILGDNYMEYMNDLIPGKNLSEGPKYKAMMELVSGKDRELMEKAMYCLFEAPLEYGAKYQEYVSYFNRLFKGDEEERINDYSWIGVYGDLFKFAKLPSYFDVRNLFPGRFLPHEKPGAGQEVEIQEEALDINLTDAEKDILSEICSLWEKYKQRLDKMLPLVERAYVIDKGYNEIEKSRNESLHNIFDRIRAIKYMINSFISEGGSEKDFYDKTGFTFRNAFAKLDNWIYILLKVFPSDIANFISKHYINKLPRTMVKDDSPYFSDVEEGFFESKNVKDYESGNISGTEENGSEVIYREKPESKLPAGGLSSYRGASSFNNALKFMKKFSKKTSR